MTFLEQLPALTFQYASRKLNITYEDNGDIAKYWLWDSYIPMGDAVSALDQTVWTVYMPQQAWGRQPQKIQEVVADYVALTKNTGLHYGQASILRNMTLREALFGYTDPFLQLLSDAAKVEGKVISPVFPGLLPNITSEQQVFQKFQPIKAYTGKHTRYRAYEYTQWNGMAEMQCCATGPCKGFDPEGGQPTWNTVDANTVRGTTGTQFRQNVKKGDSLFAFEDLLFRSVELVNVNKQVIKHHAIDTLRFTLKETLLLNSTENPANAAYNMNGPSGLLNISACAQNAPVFVSKPHFLGGSSSLLGNVSGLSPPTLEQHDTVLDVEPITGSTFYAHERLQVNTLVSNATKCIAGDFLTYKQVSCQPAARELFMPLVWVDRWAELSNEDAMEFRKNIGTALEVSRDLSIALPVLASAALVAVCTMLFMMNTWANKQQEHVLDPQDGICACCAPRPTAPLNGADQGGYWNALGGDGYYPQQSVNSAPAGNVY